MTELTIGKTMFMIMNIVIYQILGFFCPDLLTVVVKIVGCIYCPIHKVKHSKADRKQEATGHV